MDCILHPFHGVNILALESFACAANVRATNSVCQWCVSTCGGTGVCVWYGVVWKDWNMDERECDAKITWYFFKL